MDGLRQPSPIDEQVWERFRQYVERKHGGIRGVLREEVETALQRQMGTDDTARIRDEHADILERLDELEQKIEEVGEGEASGSESERERDSVSQTTVNRIRDIMEELRAEAERMDTPKVKEQDVEAAIQEHAGHSYETIRRYKSLLQNKERLFPDPLDEDVFYVRPGPFIVRVENHISERHPDKAYEIRMQYGKEWWQDNAPDGLLEDGDDKMFQ